MTLICQNPERCYSMSCGCPLAPEPIPAPEPPSQDDNED